MRIFVFFLILSLHAFSQNPEQILKQLVSQSYLKHAGISLEVLDLSNNQSILNYQANLAIPPASTIKLWSTATAYEVLGADYRPQTRLYTDGTIEAGVLTGNLFIRGGGDPTIGSMYFGEHHPTALQPLVDLLKKAGIHTIKGQIIADAHEFGYLSVPDYWAYADLGNYYGAGTSGLVIYDNMVDYYFKTSANGQPAILSHTFPIVDSLQLLNMIVSAPIHGDNSYIYGAPYQWQRMAVGKLPVNQSSFKVKGSLPDPEQQFAKELFLYCSQQGLSAQGGWDFMRRRWMLGNDKVNYSQLKEIGIHRGMTVHDIATLTNHKSINLFAEQLLCLTGYQQNGDGSTENSAKKMERFWNNQMDIKGAFFHDGSGLSRANAVSAAHFCRLLSYMQKSNQKDAFLQSLPIAGQSGTIASLCKNQAGSGRIYAKSGTMNKIKSYAGYLDAKSGKRYAFAVIFNNYDCSNSTLIDQIERLLNACVNEL